MSVTVSVRELGGATEVVLGGAIGGEVMSVLGNAIGTAVTRTGLKIVLNLDYVTLVDRRSLEAFLAPLDGYAKTGLVSVVCRRTSATRLLRRWRLAGRFPIHRSFEDALADERS